LRTPFSGDGRCVLDGTAIWFEEYAGGRAVLQRTPSLSQALYGCKPELFHAAILSDNPWILTAFNYGDPRTNTSLRASALKVRNRMELACQQIFESDFMPRGLWGLDYIFKPRNHMASSEDFEFSGLRLIPLEEYLKRVI
jgi:hypothetical protein